MENLVLLLATTLAFRYKTSKRFRTFEIGNTGATVRLPKNFDGFEHSLTAHGDDFFLGEGHEGAVQYGVLYIRLKEPMENLEAQTLMTTYLEKLQGPMNIDHNTGYHYCLNAPDASPVRKIQDYWQDKWGRDWKVKGYTDGNFMAVLYVQNISDVVVKRQDFFLDSLTVPTRQLAMVA